MADSALARSIAAASQNVHRPVAFSPLKRRAMPALVTIGIPCFNADRWLRTAIESALAQTWPSIEVIVVDDGSTDGSVAVAQSFGDRVRVLSLEHHGGNHARNQ